MKVNNTRYGIIAMFGSFAISSCVVAYRWVLLFYCGIFWGG